MKVAVLIPVYNAEQYLKECLDSVLANEGVDIFAADDGSRDGSWKILSEYAAANPRVHISRHDNVGVSKTRNGLLDALPVEYDAVGFVDSDDLIAPTMFAALAESLERTGADIAECAITHERGELWSGDAASITAVESVDLRSGAWINIVNKLYRRSTLGEVRFRNGLYFEEDNFFNR